MRGAENFVCGGKRERLHFSISSPSYVSPSSSIVSRKSSTSTIEIAFSRVEARRRSFCAPRAMKFEYACTINARQVYRERRKMRFSRPPSYFITLFTLRLCLVKVARVSLKIGRLLFKLLSHNWKVSLQKNFFPFFP